MHILVLLFAAASLYATPGTLVKKWSFEATCQNPSTTIDGSIDVVHDSASYVVGAVHLNGHTLPFHGRHLAQRFLFRTDPGYFPVLRLDCMIDSLGESYSGKLKVSKIHAKESRKKTKNYFDVLYDLYAVPK